MALTEEQIAEKLEEVQKIRFTLDSDPSLLGLNSINHKLAELQLAKDRVASLLLEAMRNSAEHEILKETVQHKHDRQLEYLAATDSACLAAKSAEARSMQARLKMPDMVLELHHADIAQIKANWYLKILQSVHSNLESANSNLSRQITVVQLSSNLGEGHFNNPQTRGVTKNITL